MRNEEQERIKQRERDARTMSVVPNLATQLNDSPANVGPSVPGASSNPSIRAPPRKLSKQEEDIMLKQREKQARSTVIPNLSSHMKDMPAMNTPGAVAVELGVQQVPSSVTAAAVPKKLSQQEQDLLAKQREKQAWSTTIPNLSSRISMGGSGAHVVEPGVSQLGCQLSKQEGDILLIQSEKQARSTVIPNLSRYMDDMPAISGPGSQVVDSRAQRTTTPPSETSGFVSQNMSKHEQDLLAKELERQARSNVSRQLRDAPLMDGPGVEQFASARAPVPAALPQKMSQAEEDLLAKQRGQRYDGSQGSHESFGLEARYDVAAAILGVDAENLMRQENNELLPPASNEFQVESEEVVRARYQAAALAVDGFVDRNDEDRQIKERERQADRLKPSSSAPPSDNRSTQELRDFHVKARARTESVRTVESDSSAIIDAKQRSRRPRERGANMNGDVAKRVTQSESNNNNNMASDMAAIPEVQVIPPGAYAACSGEAVRRHKPTLPDQPSAQRYAPDAAVPPEDQGEPLHENLRPAFLPQEANGGIREEFAPDIEQGKKSVTETSPPRRKKILIILGLLLLVIAIGAGVGGALAGGGTDSPLPVPTDAPSDANPESAELVKLRKELAGTVSSEVHLLNSSSPQYHALKWVLEEDDLSRVGDFEKLKARYILAVFYYSLGGQAWDDSVNPWLNRTADECSWEMVSCTEEGRITTLTQSERVGMKGTIPSELQHLPGLSTVEILNNVISGLAGALPNLRKFALQGPPRGWDTLSGLAGGIPGAIIEMTDLEHLSLKSFNLEGTISTAIGNLKQLTTLTLSHNSLSGTLTSELHALKNLMHLELGENEELGGVFMEVVSGLSELTTLHFFNNSFSGSVGSELLSMSGLRRFSLRKNKMSGSFPNFLSELTGLEELDMRMNSFRGTISTEIGDLSNLEFFLLSQNYLEGTIPTELGNFSVVRQFHLRSNYFEGTIPSELGNLTKILELFLDLNKLTGSVPKEICDLGTLSTLVVPSSVECCSSVICTHY